MENIYTVPFEQHLKNLHLKEKGDFTICECGNEKFKVSLHRNFVDFHCECGNTTRFISVDPEEYIPSMRREKFLRTI